ncbi:putative phage-type endonuclease [Streptosporangium canum]|uniref:Putative phage-type endonuclease n=1 Tax=Streptosporangium canum TaxID=324952 RepID=A0A1I4DHT1_9ACTN|nr:YqaJ viral recombinase family protein [Streptosporangium canum]SFK91666.1 putative phage-type endonuclease [Streptosporangium canum]
MIDLTTPAGVLLGRWETGSPEWRAARATRLSGSRMAAVLGLSPWESPYSTWCEMADLVQPDEQTKEQSRGHYLEPAVAAWFADQHPELMVAEAGTYVHANRPQHLANPDRLLATPGSSTAAALLEIKTDADGSGWGKPGTDQIPVYYRTQVQWYLDVLGLERAYIAVLTGRLNFAEYVVDYDPADAAHMRGVADEFLDSLLWREMPDLDAHTATYETVRKLHPDIDGDDVDIDPGLAAEFIAATADAKGAEARATKARTALAAAMGTAKRARCGTYTIATRQAKGGGTPYLVAGRKLPDPIELMGAAA